MPLMTHSKRQRWTRLASPLALVGLLVLVGFAAWAASSGPVGPPAPALQTELPAQHPVVIHQPAGPPVIDTGLRDAKGQPITANCTTCHATREANRTTNDGAQLVDFHTGLHSNHGGLTCVSCHNDEENYSSLHRADGRPIAFEKQIQLLCPVSRAPASRLRQWFTWGHDRLLGFDTRWPHPKHMHRLSRPPRPANPIGSAGVCPA